MKQAVANQIYFGNLSFAVTEDGMRRALDRLNLTPVEVKIPINRDTGKPRGFAFVTFANEVDARAALELNGVSWMGRDMRVARAEENATRHERAPRLFSPEGSAA